MNGQSKALWVIAGFFGVFLCLCAACAVLLGPSFVQGFQEGYRGALATATAQAAGADQKQTLPPLKTPPPLRRRPTFPRRMPAFLRRRTPLLCESMSRRRLPGRLSRFAFGSRPTPRLRCISWLFEERFPFSSLRRFLRRRWITAWSIPRGAGCSWPDIPACKRPNSCSKDGPSFPAVGRATWCSASLPMSHRMRAGSSL